MERKALTTLSAGNSAQILAIDDALQGPERRRLLDLGVIPGVEIKYSFQSPVGEPKAFSLLGSTIALRKEQTDQIYIKE